MAVFQFRLATLLRLREAERDERRMQLADAFQAEQIIRQHIDELDEGIRAHKELGRKASMPGKISVDNIMEAQRYEYQLFAERTVAEQRRQSILEEIERRRDRLAAADREVRILEKLRETKQDQFRAEELKKEQFAFDELAGRVAASKAED
jgi:flagellar FliJ protein